MRTRLKNIWKPENFHYHHRLRGGRGHFEGWYFKLVDPGGEQPYSIIPGVFMGDDPHCFVQILDGRQGRSWYHRYPIQHFRADRRRFEVDVAGNHFSSEGISLHIQKGETNALQAVEGELRFGPWERWPMRLTSPGVMGPYSFVPFMECKHGVLSLDHAIEGSLEVDGRKTVFDAGRGYAEKDWGRSFPSGYVWTQSNHFDQEGVSISASVAMIPWLTATFRGFLVGFLHAGRLHRFTTYTGSVIEELGLEGDHLRLRVHSPEYRLEVNARRTEGALLHAPYERCMLERVSETMTSEVEVRLSRRAGDETLFQGRGRHACLEIQGDLDSLLDGGPA